MNEVLELWSLPWHALQRKLAEPFGTTAATANMAFDAKYLSSQCSRATAPGAGGSWLARARRAVPPPHPTGR